MIVQKVPGKMISEWDGSCKAIIDTWTTYNVTLEEFKEAVLIEGVKHAQKHGGIAWIVDSSSATGNFKKEIHNFIETDIFPTFASIGIKYFITIKPENPGLTSMTVENYSAKAGPAGLQLLEADNVEVAKEWLRRNA